MCEENRNVETVEEEYVPSPKWKRVMAWVLFGIMCVAIVLWLLNIACPTWIDTVKGWF